MNLVMVSIFLEQSKDKCARHREMKRVHFVQPILCFTQAGMEAIDQNNSINGVYVVDTANLSRIITSLR